MFTIVLWGGIGDALCDLSTFPHAWIYRTLGIRTRVRYLHWRHTRPHAYANPPGTEFFRALVERFPSLQWEGETEPGGRSPGLYAFRLVRKTLRLAHGGRPFYFPLHPVLTPEEEANLPALDGRAVIAVQTHLQGTKTKMWGAKNWRRYLERLAALHPEAGLLLLEPAAEGDELAVGLNVMTTRHLNLFQLLRLIPSCSLVVSVDSWAKYAARWNEIPQIVIVPDQRPELPTSTGQAFLGYQMAGIYGRPDSRTIGLERTAAGEGVLTLETIAQLRPEELLRETQEIIAKFPLRPAPMRPP
jgi:ADP-heptose:LPS heptosyltransferase